jgi:hypothetical protein
MPKTGIGLLEMLSLVAILLPLIPVLIVFISKTYKEDVLALLMGLCLVGFIQNLLLYIPQLVPVDLLFIKASFELITYVILLVLINLVIEGRWWRETIKILLVAFISVVITIYSTRGIGAYLANIEIAQASVMILLNFVVLLQLIRRHDIFIFHSPMFWVAGGTFFYQSMFLLTHALPEYNAVLQVVPQQQKKILLLIMIIIQFGFYVVAATVAAKDDKEDPMLPI